MYAGIIISPCSSNLDNCTLLCFSPDPKSKLIQFYCSKYYLMCMCCKVVGFTQVDN